MIIVSTVKLMQQTMIECSEMKESHGVARPMARMEEFGCQNESESQEK